MKKDVIRLVYNGGRATPLIDKWIEAGRSYMTPAEFAEWKRQREQPPRECVRCHKMQTEFPAGRNVCRPCRRKQNLTTQHKHPRRR